MECAFSSQGKVRESENFTKNQEKLREFFIFRNIPGFPDSFTIKMAITDGLDNLDMHDFINFYRLFHQKFMTW